MINILSILLVSFGLAQYDYTLQDINPNSSTYNELISPDTFNNQVTLHYFGHQN